MNFERYKTLWIAGIALGVLGAAAAFMAIRSRSSFTGTMERLQFSQTSLDQLRVANPFPSPANVNVAREDLAQREAFRAKLLQEMSRNQFEPLNVEPAAFPLGPALQRLRTAARQANVEVKTEAFGFERYVADGVPASATNEVGRLTVQLQVIEHLCRVLFSGGILELVEVRRDEFEAPSAGASDAAAPGRLLRRTARAEAPVPAPTPEAAVAEEENRQYEVETVSLEFRCDPPVVWKVLNLLSADKSFLVVRDLQIQGEEPEKIETRAEPTPTAATPAAPAPMAWAGGTPGPAPAAATNEVARLVPHRERILAGQEKVKVVLTVDACRFQLPEAEQAAVPAAEAAP